MRGTTVAQPWAKLRRDADGRVTAALPLADHLLDVGATLEALLAGGGWDRALAAAAGRPVTALDRVRMVVLCALHDVGKANAGFQARSDPSAPRIGHTGPVAALLSDGVLGGSDAARALIAMIDAWGAGNHLAAVMAHHGRPLAEFRRHGRAGEAQPWTAHVGHWQAAGDRDPCADAMRMVEAVRARWPRAWDAGEPLPQAAPFVSLFAGLVTLADWLASDDGRFPVDGPHGDGRAALRAAAAAAAVAERGLAARPTPAGGFADAFDLPAPRGIQGIAADGDLGPVVLIEAETGSGKTEAALWRWLELRRRGEVDGLFFALPTRSAAVQIHRRVDRMLTRVWGADRPEAVLAVPGYLRAGDAQGQALPGREVRWDEGEPGGGGDGRWAAERANRFPAARVAVGTIDQALMGTLQVRHAHLRAAGLARSLLVVDEVHASDAYMGTLLCRLLDNHVGAGGQALLLSATLGAEVRARLLKQRRPGRAEAEALPYPAIARRSGPPRAADATGRSAKRVRVEVAGWIDDAGRIAAAAVDAARAGAAVLVVRNSVRGAVDVARAVEAAAPDLAFRVGEVATLHHGRFAADDRRRLDEAVETAFGRARTGGGRVLVGTQTLEQSLDIDADLLICDLAPMDVLLQRIGRLHRHPGRSRPPGSATPRVVVLRPAERDLAPLLGGAGLRHGLGSSDRRAGAYPDMVQIEATLRMLEANPEIEIPRDNRRLVEGALHPESTRAVAADLGAAWSNHAGRRSGAIFSERETAEKLAIDMATPFRDLVFPDDAEAVLTRLGGRDLLIDLDPPLAGPFGSPVTRIAVPGHMAHGIGARDRAEADDGSPGRFRIGPRAYVYDRWGLRAAEGR